MAGKELPKSEGYVERLAFDCVVGKTQQGIFIFDFLRPEASLLADENGSIRGYSGGAMEDVRIYTTPPTAKRIFNRLNRMIKEHEEKNGKIVLEGGK